MNHDTDRKYVRYYNLNGVYLDHGRMIYSSIPSVGQIIKPFPGCLWEVIEVKFPENDQCIEIFITYKRQEFPHCH